MVICYIVSTAASLVTCNRRKECRRYLLPYFCPCLWYGWSEGGKKFSTGFLRFVICYCAVRMTCKLSCSGPDPAKHLSVCITLSIKVPFTVMQLLMCTKLSTYLSALLIAVSAVYLANLSFLRKLEKERRKYKLARFSYYITGRGKDAPNGTIPNSINLLY